MSLDIAINKFFIDIIELVEAGLAWHLLPVETQIPLEGVSITPCGLLLEEKKLAQTQKLGKSKCFSSYFKVLSFTLLISLCFSRLTISSMISPSPRTSLQIKINGLISITASMHTLNSELNMWPAVFLMTQFSCTEPCSSALPGASRLWVHNFADHTLPGVILLLGEGPLCRESSFLLICHHCREQTDTLGLYEVIAADCQQS